MGLYSGKSYSIRKVSSLLYEAYQIDIKDGVPISKLLINPGDTLNRAENIIILHLLNDLKQELNGVSSQSPDQQNLESWTGELK
jgi:hypothetical protein